MAANMGAILPYSELIALVISLPRQLYAQFESFELHQWRDL
jgi:hypothetical protein